MQSILAQTQDYSPEEAFFASYILNLGCVSYKQAEYVLMNYYDCSEYQVERILKSLSHKGHLTIYGDKEYILSGSRLVKQVFPITRPLVEALWIALDCAEDNEDGLEDIRSFRRTENNEGLIFTSGDETFQTVHVTQDNYLQTMIRYEQIYLENHVDITLLFVFSAGANRPYIEEVLADKKFKMSGNIVYVESTDILDGIEYKITTLPGAEEE